MATKLAEFLPAPMQQMAWNSITRCGAVKSSLRRTRKSFVQSVTRDFSQAGETIAVRKITRRRHGGTFVEIGANDGINFSTTYGLLKSGWSGWSVEANPITYQKLIQTLQPFPKAKPLNLAVAPTRGPVNLFFGKDDPEGLYATISTEDSEWFRQHRSNHFVEVPGLPLSDLLTEQQVPARFDLLLVDTEGMDLEILRTLDPDRHRPYLIITEEYPPKNDEKFALLRSFGYGFERVLGCNTFWVDLKAAN